MDDFKAIQHLWNADNNLNIPKVGHFQSVLEKYQSQKKRNTILVTGLFILCGIGFVLIALFHNPLLWTTTVGKILILLGFISGIILKLNGLKSLYKDELKSNKEFLKNLIQVSDQRKKKVNWHLITSVLLIAVGYGFYIYEAINENKTVLIVSYLGIVLFIVGMYFIFRPFVAKISKNKRDKMIETVRDLE